MPIEGRRGVEALLALTLNHQLMEGISKWISRQWLMLVDEVEYDKSLKASYRYEW